MQRTKNTSMQMVIMICTDFFQRLDPSFQPLSFTSHTFSCKEGRCLPMAACLEIIFSKQGLSFTIRSVAKLYDILNCFYQFRSIYDLKEIYDGKIHLFLVSIQRNYLFGYLWSIKSNTLMNYVKALIKPFEARQRSVKNKNLS